MIRELLDRWDYWTSADRLGPDIPGTHWRLHFKSTMRELCARKFQRFGEGAEFRPGAYAIFCSNISIGRRVVIRPGTMLFANPDGGIEIEDDVLIGSGVHVYVSNHKFGNTHTPIINQGHDPTRPVRIASGSWIGANAVILPGVVVGRNAVIGAGSIVTRSVPAKTLVAGNPAKVIRALDGTDDGEGP